MYTVHAERGKAICLGREGENLARQIVFDLYEWQEMFGDGIVQLIAQRMGDAEPYPCAVTMDGNHAVWTVTNSDTAVPGHCGKCELSYYVGDAVVKSETFVTLVLDAMCKPSDETPEPYQGWLDQILAAGSYAEAERIKAEAAQVAAAESAEQSVKSAQVSAEQAAAAQKQAEQAGEYAKAADVSAGNAKTSEEAAAESAKRAEETVNNAAWVSAEVDENGHLIVTQTDNFNGATFTLNENGHLEVAYT